MVCARDQSRRDTLYRFNENENFLPFFNNTHEGERGPVEYPTPKGLRKFCDYILLAVTHNKMYVILIEMKSGSNGDAQLQLSASSTFMKYIQMTAERIKSQNHFDTFDSNNIIIKKVILKPKPTPRPTTNIAKDSSINWTADPVIIKGEVFPINKLCCHN